MTPKLTSEFFIIRKIYIKNNACIELKLFKINIFIKRVDKYCYFKKTVKFVECKNKSHIQ
jgi:hypothetical protein